MLCKFADNISERIEKQIINWQTIQLNRQKLKDTGKNGEKRSEQEGKQLKSDGIKYEINVYIDHVNINDSHDNNLYL